MPSQKVLIRRRRLGENDLSLGSLEVVRRRTFVFTLPPKLPFDHDDSDRIVAELKALDPRPDEIDAPRASGLGDLVCEAFAVAYDDDAREDWEIVLEIEEAVKRGLKSRAWLISAAEADMGSSAEKKLVTVE